MQQARYYTAEEDAVLMACGAEGVPWDQVCERMKKSTPAALRARFLKMETLDARALRTGEPVSRKQGARLRPCLNCLERFESEGFHNRLCEPCREELW